MRTPVRKTLSFLLTMLLVFGTVSFALPLVNAQPELSAPTKFDLPGNRRLLDPKPESDIIPMELNTPISVTAVPGESIFLTFTPDVSGSYLFMGTNISFAGVEVFDQNFNSLAVDWSDENCRLLQELQEGQTYSYTLTSNTEQTFSVVVKDALFLLNSEAVALTIDEPLKVSFTEVPGRYYLKFTPSVTGEYSFVCDNTANTSVWLYKEQGQKLVCSYHQNGSNFRLKDHMEVGSSCYFEVYSETEQSFHAVIRSVVAQVDSEATVLMKNTPQIVSFVDGSDCYYYKFTPETDGVYVLFGTNENYIDVELYDDSYSFLQGNEGTTLALAYRLYAGQPYYYTVYLYDSETFNITVVDLETYLASVQKTLVLNEELKAGAGDYLKFVPEASGAYVFCALGGAENRFDLLSSDLETIAYSANGVAGTAPLLPQMLEAGKTYYCRIYGNADYKVVMLEDFGSSVLAPGENAVFSGKDWSIFSFTPSENTTYLLKGSASDAANVRIYSLEEDFYSTSGSKLDLSFRAIAGKTCLIAVHGATDETEGSFTLMTEAAYIDTIAQELELDAPVSVSAGDERYFKFTPAAAGSYVLNATNPSFVSCTAYNSTMEEICNKNNENNLTVPVLLQAGETYYFKFAEAEDAFDITLSKTCDHANTLVMEAVVPTCTENGKTIGIQCTDCGETMFSPKTLSKSHKDANKDRICDVCKGPAVEFESSCNDSGTVTATLYTDGELIITGEGAITKSVCEPNRGDYENGSDYGAARDHWTQTMHRVTKLAIPEGITSIGASAFSYCHLNELTVPSTCAYIAGNAFRNSALENITVLNDSLELVEQFEVPCSAPYYKDGVLTESPVKTVADYKAFYMTGQLFEVLYYLKYQIKDIMQEYSVNEEQAKLISAALYANEFLAYLEVSDAEIPQEITFGTLVSFVLDKLNGILDTSFAEIDDILIFDETDRGNVNLTPAFSATFRERFGASFEDRLNICTQSLGASNVFEGVAYTAVEGVTVHANCSSTAQTAAQVFGAAFDLLAHRWSEWTAADDGEHHTRLCAGCGSPESYPHEWNAGEVTKEPTEEETGERLYTCTVCSATKTETIPKLNDHKPGDINGDGVVNNKDLNRLMKYLAGENVDYVEAALDVNGDGKVNNKDLNRLMKHLAGENVEIH